MYAEPKGLQRSEDEGTGKRVGATLEWHRQGRLGCPNVCNSTVAGVSLKGTSNTRIFCEPSFIIFIMDRSFLHFPAFASPFFSVALKISVGLYFLCFYVKKNKESKRKVIFISHCILTRQWATYGMGVSSPPSWFSFQTIRTLPTSLFWDTIQNQLNWRS